jgi:hypothetical protein
MSLKLLFVTRLIDRTSTEVFLRAIARFTKIRPLWYHSSDLWGLWLGSEDNHFINHSGYCQHLSLTPPVYCVTLFGGVWLLAFHKTGLSARVQRPCRQSLCSAAEGNILISLSDCTLSLPQLWCLPCLFRHKAQQRNSYPSWKFGRCLAIRSL